MARKTIEIAGALGLLAAGAVTFNQSEAGPRALWTRWWEPRSVTAPAGFSFAAMDPDLLRGRVTFRGVRFGEITAGSLTLSMADASRPLILLAQAGGAGPAAGAATATDVTITTDASTYKIKRVELTGTTLTNGDLAALLDPKSPDPLEQKLKKISAKSILVTGLSSDRTTPDGHIHGEAGPIELNDVMAGRIGSARTPGVTITGLGVDSAGTVKTGMAEATGLDLALLDHLLNTGRSDDNEPLKPLADAFSVHDISVVNTGNDTTLNVASLSEKGLKARPLKTSLQAIHEAAKADTAMPEPGEDDDAKAERTKAIAEDILSSYEAESFSAGKIVLTTVSDDGPVKLETSGITLQDFKNRRFGTLDVSDFSIESPHIKAAFATFAVTSLTVPPFVTPDDGDASGDSTASHLPSAAKADLTKLSIEVSSEGEDGGQQGYKFKIGHAGSTSESAPGGKNVQNNVTVDNLTFDLNPGSDRPGARELMEMGYKAIDMSAVLAAKFDRGKETLSVQKFDLNGVGLGSLSLAIDLVNVNKGVFSSNPAIAKASALAVLLKRADLRVVEGGLIDKILALKAKRDGKSLAEERVSEANFFAVELPDAAGGDPALRTIGAAIAKFIAAPKNLHISAVSADGIGVTDLGLVSNPTALLGRLDIHAEANQ